MEKDSPPDRDISARLVPRYLVFHHAKLPARQLYVARTLSSNSKLKIAKDSSPYRDNSGVKCLHGEIITR